MSTTADLLGRSDQLLDPDDLAAVLRLHPSEVRRMARDREIPAIRLGRFWRFQRSSIEAWLAERERGAR